MESSEEQNLANGKKTTTWGKGKEERKKETNGEKRSLASTTPHTYKKDKNEKQTAVLTLLFPYMHEF